ncbi:hypothetical protein Tco_0320915 [Tanacetum coccineum]
MELDNYEEPAVLVTYRSRKVECLGGETDIVPLSYHIVDDFQIQFGREEFCLLTRLRFRFVLLGLEDRRKVSDWILMLTNDRDCWDMYPWGSYVWPTLYSQLKNANVKRWHSLYAAEQEKVDDTKAYSVFGFTWAFKIWILESFRIGAHEYYRRQRRYPRVVAWSAKRKFFRNMLRGHLDDYSELSHLEKKRVRFTEPTQQDS